MARNWKEATVARPATRFGLEKFGEQERLLAAQEKGLAGVAQPPKVGSLVTGLADLRAKRGQYFRPESQRRIESGEEGAEERAETLALRDPAARAISDDYSTELPNAGTHAGVQKVAMPDGSTTYAYRGGKGGAATTTFPPSVPEGATQIASTRSRNSLGIAPDAFGPAGQGSFSVAVGDRGGVSDADWENMNQAQRTAIRVAAIKERSAALRGAREEPGQRQAAAPAVASSGGLSQRARDEEAYARGDVGSVGYGRHRRRLRDERKIAGEGPDAAGNRTRLRIASMAAAGRGGQTGPDFGDQLALERLNLDRNKYGTDILSKGAELNQAAERERNLKQHRDYQNDLATAKNDRERQQYVDEQVMAAGKDQQFDTAQFPVPVNRLLYEYGVGRPPKSVMEALNSISTGAGEELVGMLRSTDAEQKAAGLNQVRAMLDKMLN